MHMDHKFSEIDHVTPLFNLFLVVHLPTVGKHLYAIQIVFDQDTCMIEYITPGI